MRSILILAAAAAVLAVGGCGKPAPAPTAVSHAPRVVAENRIGATITEIGKAGTCTLFRVETQGRSFYVASAGYAGCALMTDPNPDSRVP